jgi:hypothetical protein
VIVVLPMMSAARSGSPAAGASMIVLIFIARSVER